MTARGPQVDLTLTFWEPERAYVREMLPGKLYQTLNDWVRWQSIHGRGRTEAAIHFKKYAQVQKERIRAELQRRGFPRSPCPVCDGHGQWKGPEGEERVYCECAIGRVLMEQSGEG